MLLEEQHYILKQKKKKTSTLLLYNHCSPGVLVLLVAVLQGCFPGPIHRGLPLARGGAFCISFVLNQQVVFETQCTPMVTQFTSTVNANNRTGRTLKLNLPFKRPLSLSISAQGGLPSTMLLLHRILISQTTG